MSKVITTEPTVMQAVEAITVEVPKYLEHRKRDDNYLPIPSVTGIPSLDDIRELNITYSLDPRSAFSPMSGIDYDAVDWRNWLFIAQGKRCCYCAHPLDYHMFFVVSMNEVAQGVFVNPPMHAVCLHYFMQVYPLVHLPRMRNDRRSLGGVLPTRLGIYKVRDFKVYEPPVRTRIINFLIKPGAQRDITMWVDYPQPLMQYYHELEQSFYEQPIPQESTNPS